MKKLTFTIFFLSFLTNSSALFSQRILWSNVKNDSLNIKYVENQNIGKEVLKLFNVYDQYYDLTGYTKSNFLIQTGLESELFKEFEEIKELLVLAFKANDGNGSFVIVMIIKEDYIDAIVFSNHMIGFSSSYILTVDEDQFINWFESLLN